MASEILLKVAEAVQDDVNKGIVRIDSNFMKQINANPGDIVEIAGERTTVAIVGRSYPGDIGLNIIRADGLVRRNAKTSIGESVKVKKVSVKEAKKVTIAPAAREVRVSAAPSVLKRGLLGRVVVKGDVVSLGGVVSRRKTFSENPTFEDIFSSMFEDSMLGFGLGSLRFVVVNVMPKEAAIITEKTQLEFQPEAVEEVEDERVLGVTYEDIGGLQDEVKKIREMVELPLKHPEIFERLGIEPPKGVLLHGPPGTGKTLLAKAVANETDSNFIVINGPEIMGKFYGESEQRLRDIFDQAEKNAPSIIFIDEIDAIASKREETHGEVERRVVAQLLALMDGMKNRGKVVVIAASNRPDALDPALRRPGRFDREIDIGVPKKPGRLDILKIHTRNMPLDKTVNLDQLAEVTHGFVGADLESLAKEAAMVVLRRVLPDLKLDKQEAIPKEILEKMIITMEDFKEALKTVRPSALREVAVQVPNVTWSDIGGLDNVKQELKEAVEWPLKKPHVFKRMGVKPPKAILLYGAPGTGKTLLAKAVANESEANFILVNGPELLSKFVGESEKGVRKVFAKARQAAPSIIFFDEIDAIAPRRGLSFDSHVTERVVNQILTEMDGLQELADVVIIGATNRPDIIDPALLRPGRFDRIILAEVPDEKTRKKIFDVHLKNMPLDGVKASELAKLADGYVGADIEAVCREAAMIALREDIKAKTITMKHFEEAMKKVRPSVDKEIQETYQELADHFKKATAEQIKKDRPSYLG
jgi:transitional endoplasmic reticulum ATPase